MLKNLKMSPAPQTMTGEVGSSRGSRIRVLKRGRCRGQSSRSPRAWAGPQWHKLTIPNKTKSQGDESVVNHGRKIMAVGEYLGTRKVGVLPRETEEAKANKKGHPLPGRIESLSGRTNEIDTPISIRFLFLLQFLIIRQTLQSKWIIEFYSPGKK